MPTAVGPATAKKKTDILDAINGVVGAVQTAGSVVKGAGDVFGDKTAETFAKQAGSVAPAQLPAAQQLPSDRMLAQAPAILRRAKQSKPWEIA